MEKLFHFDCPREHYRADACVISCFDARFNLAIRKFLKRSGIAVFDHVQIPGSAKSLASPEYEAEREFVKRMVATSVRLHRPERALVIGHSECGAYAGQPRQAILDDVVRATDLLRPLLPAEGYFADFDGIYRI
jgi:hypothetical protein